MSQDRSREAAPPDFEEIGDLICNKHKWVTAPTSCRSPRALSNGSEGRCRKCSGCLKWRAEYWSRRARQEYLAHPRTWWVTLTLKDEGVSYEQVRVFIKRLRRNSDPCLRYLAVEETGTKHGRVHWHVLIHCHQVVKKRTIVAAWPHGIVHSRLSRNAGYAMYMAKYQAKMARFKGSQYYGKITQRVVDDTEPDKAQPSQFIRSLSLKDYIAIQRERTAFVRQLHATPQSRARKVAREAPTPEPEALADARAQALAEGRCNPTGRHQPQSPLLGGASVPCREDGSIERWFPPTRMDVWNTASSDKSSNEMKNFEEPPTAFSTPRELTETTTPTRGVGSVNQIVIKSDRICPF